MAAYSVSLGKVQTALSYSIKTDRPSFFAMNDAVTYISRYTLQAGNSQLLNESGDLGYNQFRQTNRYSTHKLYLTLSYRLNATRSKYKGTGAGKETQERISS